MDRILQNKLSEKKRTAIIHDVNAASAFFADNSIDYPVLSHIEGFVTVSIRSPG